MPRARKEQVDLNSTPYYHCTTYCVQQMYLCGTDQTTGKNYDHRRQWIVERLKLLTENFAIDVCAYAVMHNHYHLVLRVNKEVNLTDSEVITKWGKIYSVKHPIIERIIVKKASKSDEIAAKKLINTWRSRLKDLSWFMRALNENIARKANKESGRRGHFWGARFKSQALLDKLAILSCMTYVDLNPVRANMANNLIESQFTSIQERLFFYAKAAKENPRNLSGINKSSCPIQNQPKTLLPFVRHEDLHGIFFPLTEYFKLVELTGKIKRPDKRGYIEKKLPDITKSLKITLKQWLFLSKRFKNIFSSCSGKVSKAHFDF